MQVTQCSVVDGNLHTNAGLERMLELQLFGEFDFVFAMSKKNRLPRPQDLTNRTNGQLPAKRFAERV